MLGAELRALLHLCFGATFKHKRYYFGTPQHRWLVRAEGTLIAHLAVHDKTFESGHKVGRFLGVAEVCVAPPYRNRGLAKTLLRAAEAHFSEVAFVVLLGDLDVCSSSGYRLVDNVYFPFMSATNPQSGVLVKPLGSEVWPQGELIVKGPLF